VLLSKSNEYATQLITDVNLSDLVIRLRQVLIQEVMYLLQRMYVVDVYDQENKQCSVEAVYNHSIATIMTNAAAEQVKK
jgi:hypothetical protein